MSEGEDNPRLAEIRNDFLAALQQANDVELSRSAFLSSFPPTSADGHREILLRMRQNLLELLERGYSSAFDLFLQSCDVAKQMKILDRSTLNDAALSGAMSDVSEENSLEAIGETNPIDQLMQARLSSKKAEAARLESIVDSKDASNASLKAHLLQMAADYRVAQAEVTDKVGVYCKVTDTLGQP